jgi:hypothetical protein
MALRHISGWVDVSGPDGPIDPGYGQRPPYGGGRPDNELPGGGGRPDNELPGGGYVWGTYAKLIKWLAGPHIDIKPPGAPILPIDPGWSIPILPPHPWLPGSWIPVDPGYGKPPLWGFLPVDPGFGVGGGGPRPDNDLPGHWVPIDPDYGIPERERRCGGGEHPWGKPPLWVWIAEIGPEVGLPIAGTPQPK